MNRFRQTRLWSRCFGWIALVVAPFIASIANGEVAPGVQAAIEAAMPAGWTVEEINAGAVPYGHHWGEAYQGERGTEFVLQGPRPMHYVWRDREGAEHSEPLGREALIVYVMPSSYAEGSFMLKGPIPAKAIFLGRTIQVYGLLSFRVLDKSRFDQVTRTPVQEASWTTPGSKTGPQLSWAAWKRDIRAAMQGL